VVHRLGQRHHGLEDAQALERGVGVGDQAVATGLVARKGVLVGQADVDAGAGQGLGTGAAGRAGADDQHLAGGGE
jgi:hypothetical protein